MEPQSTTNVPLRALGQSDQDIATIQSIWLQFNLCRCYPTSPEVIWPVMWPKQVTSHERAKIVCWMMQNSQGGTMSKLVSYASTPTTFLFFFILWKSRTHQKLHNQTRSINSIRQQEHYSRSMDTNTDSETILDRPTSPSQVTLFVCTIPQSNSLTSSLSTRRAFSAAMMWASAST